MREWSAENWRNRPHFCPGEIGKALDGTTFVLSLERKIMILMGGVGGRIALLCLGWMTGAVGIYPAKAMKQDQARGKLLPCPWGNGEPLSYKLRNVNISERLIQTTHEE